MKAERKDWGMFPALFFVPSLSFLELETTVTSVDYRKVFSSPPGFFFFFFFFNCSDEMEWQTCHPASHHLHFHAPRRHGFVPRSLITLRTPAPPRGAALEDE